MGAKTIRYSHRDAAMVIFVAAIFILAVVYSVFSTTIGESVNTGGTLTVSGASTLTGAINASSTLQVTGDGLFYDQLSAGASTNTPTTTFNVTGSGYFTGGLGVGYATTGTGNLLVSNLGVFQHRLGVASTSPVRSFEVGGSGLFSDGLGVGYATTSGFRVAGTGLFDNRVGVTATTAPYQELGVGGDIAASSNATTTVSAESTGTEIGSCIELKGGRAQGEMRWIRIYVGGSGATNTTAAGTIPSAVIQAGGVGLLVIQEGRCQ
ncbi:MAG: hypothetical protein AAB650_01590 [Patescibacteria group bacterium]